MPAGERVLLEVRVIFLRQVLNKLPVAVVVVLLPKEASRCKSSNTLLHIRVTCQLEGWILFFRVIFLLQVVHKVPGMILVAC